MWGYGTVGRLPNSHLTTLLPALERSRTSNPIDFLAPLLHNNIYKSMWDHLKKGGDHDPCLCDSHKTIKLNNLIVFNTSIDPPVNHRCLRSP
jgi:hypothetical protein